MDTTAQNKVSGDQQTQQNVNPSTSSGTNVVQPAVQPPSQSTSVPAGKEGSPVISNLKPEKWMQETAPKADVPPAVAEAGVEASNGEVLEVAPDVAQAGVKATGAATPIPTEPTFHFPMTEEEALKKSSGPGKTKLSAAWLAMLVLRQMKILQFKKNKKEKK